MAMMLRCAAEKQDSSYSLLFQLSSMPRTYHLVNYTVLMSSKNPSVSDTCTA